MGSGHVHEDGAYLKSIADTLGAAHEIVVCGPAAAKDEFVSWLEAHAPEIRARVVGVEAMDQATGGEIVAFAKKYFVRKDRMTPQIA
jgi:stalled ribosome rescue protein Dom34